MCPPPQPRPHPPRRSRERPPPPARGPRAGRPGGTRCSSLLYVQFRGTAWKAQSQAMMVRGGTGRGRYPDVLIVSRLDEQFEFHPEEKELGLLNPLVLFEVPSDSTAATDSGDKLEDYASIPSVTDYLIVHQHQLRVEHHARTADGWRDTVHEDPDAAVTFAEPAVTLPLAEIYEGVLP